MSFLESFWSRFPSWLAQGKDRSPIGFFAIAFYFSPVLGLLTVMAARDLRSVSETQMARDEFRVAAPSETARRGAEAA